MKFRLGIILLFAASISLFQVSCSKDGGVNLFTIEDEIKLGEQLHQEILSMPDSFPILDRQQYAEEYAYVEEIMNDILASGDVTYANEFPWQVHIIDKDVLNAFAAPGGYTYYYTGLIKFLDNKDDFVGVMGHEMAHVDERHSTEQLTKVYGVSVLLDILVGNNQSVISDVLASLLFLSFSRNAEEEADERSVNYLCDTEYAANGAAGFFEKLIETEMAGSPPQFLSTHPNPDNRVENINSRADQLGCDTTYDSDHAKWLDFQEGLP